MQSLSYSSSDFEVNIFIDESSAFAAMDKIAKILKEGGYHLTVRESALNSEDKQFGLNMKNPKIVFATKMDLNGISDFILIAGKIIPEDG